MPKETAPNAEAAERYGWVEWLRERADEAAADPDRFPSSAVALSNRSARSIADALAASVADQQTMREALGCAEYALMTGSEDDRVEALRLVGAVLARVGPDPETAQ